MRPENNGEIADAALRARLQNVYWIGGGSGAGKSTIARRSAAQYGMHVYATDEVMSDHASRSTSEDAPYLSSFKAMDMDERWVKRSPKTMLRAQGLEDTKAGRPTFTAPTGNDPASDFKALSVFLEGAPSKP